MSHSTWKAGDRLPRRKDRPRCHARTRVGGACLVRAEPGKARCRFHGGLSTGTRTEEERARIAEAQRRRWRAYGDSQSTQVAMVFGPPGGVARDDRTSAAAFS